MIKSNDDISEGKKSIASIFNENEERSVSFIEPPQKINKISCVE